MRAKARSRKLIANELAAWIPSRLADAWCSLDAAWQKRKDQVRENFSKRFAGTADRNREKLKAKYGAAGEAAKFAEAFEICEYGRRPKPEELAQLFPF